MMDRILGVISDESFIIPYLYIGIVIGRIHPPRRKQTWMPDKSEEKKSYRLRK